MLRFRPTAPLLAACLLATTALAGEGCSKKKDDETKGKDETKTEETPDPAVETAAAPTPAETKEDSAAAAADSGAPELLTVEGGLGHVLIPSPTALLAALRDQAAPASAASFLNETMLRMGAGMSLGEQRAAIAQKFDFQRTVGCALLDSDLSETPIACLFGYQGGAQALTTDLGQEGRSDPGSHAGHFTLEGIEFFIDDLGGYVAVTTADGLLEPAKPYLQKALLDRTNRPSVAVEIETFPSASFRRYEALLTPFFEQMSAAVPSDGTPFGEALSEYSKASQQTTIDYWKGTEELRIEIGFDAGGLAIRGITAPKPDTETAAAYARMAGTPDPALLAKLPASSWLAVTTSHSGTSLLESKSFEVLKNGILQVWAEQIGKDPAELGKQVDAWFASSKDVYEPRVAAGIGAQDGRIAATLVVPLKDGKSWRGGWKTWSEGFTPDAVLGAEGAKLVEWKFQADAAKVDEVAIDRWTITPTAAGKKKMLADTSAEDKAILEKLSDGYRVTVERAEVDGSSLMVIALGEATPHTKAALEAIGGKQGIDQAPGYASISKVAADSTMLLALDIRRASDWLRSVLPEKDAADIPAKLGVDLSDVLVSGQATPTHAVTTIRVAQPFIDQLRSLADQAPTP